LPNTPDEIKEWLEKVELDGGLFPAFVVETDGLFLLYKIISFKGQKAVCDGGPNNTMAMLAHTTHRKNHEWMYYNGFVLELLHFNTLDVYSQRT